MTTIPKDILERLKKVVPRTKWLSKILGGVWTYDRKMHEWICDDGKRVVQKRVSIHDEECRYPEWYVYEEGKTPERIFA